MKRRIVLLLVGLPLGLNALAYAIPNADAGTETNLYSFGVSPNDGQRPEARLVRGWDGNFYGTTYYGGTNNLGTVFRINPNGSYTNLYSFVGYPTDGAYPIAGLVQGRDGNFYGTTYEGGTNSSCDCGTVFRISPNGSYTNLYSFLGSPTDGADPAAGLVQGSDGNFYGTTVAGGTSGNYGTVFRIGPSGVETTLYSFGSSSPYDGENPYAGLVQGRDGNFYGTTFEGGTGYGTVFRISPSGSYTSLYSFVGINGFVPPYDGEFPAAGLVQGRDGNFYGTTFEGGTGYGTVFRISPSGTETNLYSFVGIIDGGGSSNDGEFPLAGLVQGRDGSFYGTASGGGSNYDGTVFKLTVPLCQPPVISGIAVTPNVFWPPNHKLVLVTLDYTTTENCGVADCELSATCNESDGRSGHRDTVNDIQLIPGDAHHVYLRGERSPSGFGRVYTITITCTDTSGNVTTKTAEVTVPHDQGEN